jgi:LPS export ABC transporter protein LptC
MASWHQRARLGVAIFGVVVAGIVYFAIDERPTAAPPQPVKRLDPKAVLEITSGILQGMTGIEKNFEIRSSTLQTFPDGSTKHLDATIVVRKGEDRSFKVSAKQAIVNKAQTDIELTGSVRLEDSDGFFLATDAATYDRQRSIARTPAAVTFGKGRMSGSGVGITYDQANNLLEVSDQAQVTTRNEAGDPVMEFAAGSATLDRLQHRLTVDNSVHVDRAEQVIESDRGIASLSENDDIIRFLELRGNARVEGGGGGIDAMSARDIDLDYTDDGQRLEAVVLDGMAAVARTGQNGAAQQIVSERIDLKLAADGSSHMLLTGNAGVTMLGDQGREGRRIAADNLELDVADDSSLTRAVGRERVRLDLPAAADTPGRSITAKSLDGTGKAGVGLTNAIFTGDVVFTEGERKVGQAAGAAAAPASTRTARAARLEAALANDAVSSATFTTDVSFEEAGLKACAARLDYQPDKGTLALSGDTAAGKPIVAEEQTAIEASTIDVTLDSRRMIAKGSVVTQIGTPVRCRPATGRPAAQQGPSRMPGLLREGAAATIRAAALDYEGAAGKAVYSGRASITQSDTSINADGITLDQKNGDLTATGNAITTMVLDGGTTLGRAHEIVYVDAKQVIRYAAPPPGTILPPVPAGRGPAPAREPQVSGPQGDLRAASRIDVTLAMGGGEVERIDAYGNVRLQEGTRVASGGDRLTYDAAEGKYVMTSGTTAPVVLVADCRESRGKTLTFYKANDTIRIDGESERRTDTSNAGGPCTPVAAPR